MSRTLRMLMLAAAITLTACPWKNEVDDPEIASFRAAPEAASQGGAIELVASFAHGSGRIEPGVGPVQSGAPVTVVLQQDTRFTLTVTHADGTTVTEQLWVPVILTRSWDFDADAPDWVLTAGADAHAEVADGALLVDASQFVAFDGSCTAASAVHLPADAKFQSGGYQTVEVRFDMRYASGTGMGYPSIGVSYGGRILNFLPGELYDPVTIRVVFDAVAGTVSLYRADQPVEVSSGEPWAGPHGIVLSADACAADLESETIVLDALSISGR